MFVQAGVQQAHDAEALASDSGNGVLVQLHAETTTASVPLRLRTPRSTLQPSSHHALPRSGKLSHGYL